MGLDAIDLGPRFDGFSGLSLALLVLAGGAAAAWLALFAWRWFATFPYLPDAAPATADLRDEPPAVVNFLVNRWRVTHTAIAATVADLAARKMLEIDQLDRDHFVVRLQEHRIEGQPLSPYERQVLDVLRARATGGSAPAEALLLDGEADAEHFWMRFAKAVVKDARARGLARNRWAKADLAVLGAGLAGVLALFAAAFGMAHLFEGVGSSGDEWGRWDWFYAAGFAWLVIVAVISSRRDVRDTPAGDAACAHWLAVRAYLREARALDDAPLAAVILWERYLSYGMALGAAPRAARALPFAAEDPGVAWSRTGGDWHTLRIAYPAWFGACQPPVNVFLAGLARTAVAGFIAFFALPMAIRFTWDMANEVLDGSSTGVAEQDRALRILAVVLVAVFGGIALVLATQLARGLVRLWRAGGDLVSRPRDIEGDVVKVHLGRVAVDDGQSDEAVAWFPPRGAAALTRGARIRIRQTPRLHYVSQVEVLHGGVAPAAASGGADEDMLLAPAGLDAARLRSITGLDLQPMPSAGDGHVFADSAGNRLAVNTVPLPALAGRALAAVAGRSTARGIPVAGLGTEAAWIDGRLLVAQGDGRLVTIDATLPGVEAGRRMDVARDVAAAVLKTG